MDERFAEAWQVIGRYLVASCPPYDLMALHEVSAPDSLLVIGNFLRPKRDLSASRYAEMVERLLALLTDEQVGPSFEPLQPLAWLPDAGGASLLASLRERSSGREVTALFRLDEEHRVFGGCLHEGRLPAPATAKALCLAELAHWESHDQYPVWPITGLALSFHRHFEELDRPLLALPESRFTCQGRGLCCHITRWSGISVNANAKVAVSAMPWAEMGVNRPTLAVDRAETGEVRSGRAWIGRDAAGDCTALMEGVCSLHASLGWQPLNPCMQYPFVFTVTPDGICVTASYTCPTVAENQGESFADRQDDIRQRFQPVRHRIPVVSEPLWLEPGGPPVAWQAWRLVEARLLDLLADTSVVMGERLRLGSRLLLALRSEAAEPDRPIDPAVATAVIQGAWPALPPAAAGEVERLVATAFTSTAPDVPHAVLGGGRREAWDLGQGRRLDEALDEPLLVRYLRTVVFRKLGMAQMGAIFPWATALWLHRLWHRDAWYRSMTDGAPIDQALQLATVCRIERLHLHSALRRSLYAADSAFALGLIKPETWSGLLEP